MATRKTKLGARLMLEGLETRITPVIGRATLPPAVVPGVDVEDAVVQVGYKNVAGHITKFGTGSLLYSSTDILTARHVLDPNNAGFVQFDLKPTLNSTLTKIPVTINTFANKPGETYQVGHANYTEAGAYGANDIGIIHLVDQADAVANRAGTRMVAPKGAERLKIQPDGAFAATEFKVIGYGRTGTGNFGNHSDEIQKLTFTNANTLFSSFWIKQGNLATVPLGGGALGIMAVEAKDVAAALEKVPSVGVGNVVVERIVTGATTVNFDVRFVGGLGGENVADLVPEVLEGAPAVVASRLDVIQGAVTIGVKRQGTNVLDVVVDDHNNNPNILKGDFDDGNPAHNANVGSTLGTTDEVNVYSGDSGAPAIVTSGGENYIAGVAKSVYTALDGTDVTNYQTPAGSAWPDGSYGEWFSYTRASKYTDWIRDNTVVAPYDLVLDMRFQAFVSTAWIKV